MRTFKYRRPDWNWVWVNLLESYIIQNLSNILADFDQNQTQSQSGSHDTALRLWISYVPMHQSKLKSRIYNPPELLASKLVSRLQKTLPQELLAQTKYGLNYHKLNEIIFARDLFTRIKNTPSLFNKNRILRELILKDSFVFSKNFQIKEKNFIEILIILDDITTTGTSFVEIINSIPADQFDEVICIAASGRNR